MQRHAPRIPRWCGSSRGIWGHVEKATQAVGLVPGHGEVQDSHTRQTQRTTTPNLVASLLERGEKAEASNFELWDDRPFPECSLQLRTPEKQVAPGTLWAVDVLEAGLGEPNIPDKQQNGVASPETAPGTMTPSPSDTTRVTHHQGTHRQGYRRNRHPDVPRQIKRPIQRNQGSRPTRHTCYGRM